MCGISGLIDLNNNLKYEDNFFDVVTCVGTFTYGHVKAHALNEMLRIIKKNGLASSLFLIFYSLFRFICEFTREPDPQIGYLIFNLTMGQIISVIFFISGIILFYSKNEIK